jgi:hypothetical protein
MDINSQHQNLLGNKFRPNRRIFVFWWPFCIQNGYHSKLTMNVNSQHLNLFGKTNFAQIGGFFYLAAILYLGYHGNGSHFDFFQSLMMLRIDIQRWFAMAAILNPKWPPKYKYPPIWVKFGFQIDFDVAN